MNTHCSIDQHHPSLTSEQRFALFLMSAPRSVGQTIIGHLSLDRARQIGASSNTLPPISNEERRVIQESVARVIGVTVADLSVLFCKRPQWALAMIEYWAVRGTYLANQVA